VEEEGVYSVHKGDPMKAIDRVVRIREVMFDPGELDELMRGRGLTDENLAERSGHSVAAIRLIREGKQAVDLMWAIDLCRGLNTSVPDIFGNLFD